MGASGKPQAVKKGIITLDATASYITIPHNIGSDNYILLLRHLNPTLRDSHSHGGILIGNKITEDYNFNGSGNYQLLSFVIESRPTLDYYGGPMGESAYVYANFTNMSSLCNSRQNGYSFATGTYEWVAINLDADADVNGEFTLTSDTYEKTITDNLGTTDKIGIMMMREPVYGEQNVIVNVGLGNFFSALTNTSTGFGIGFESRTGKTFSQLSESQRCGITDNTINIQTRANTYVYKEGDYSYKVYKI